MEAIRFRKGMLRGKQFRGNGPEPVDVEFPGLSWGNLGIFKKSPDWWSIIHQPSGLGLRSARTLRVARQVVASIAHFDLRVLDRAAMGTTDNADEMLLRQIKAIVKGTPGTF